MRVVHIMPTDSAGGSMRRALAEAGIQDRVLPFRDDLSCGPIASDSPANRATWWGQFYDVSEVEVHLRAFWDQLESTDARIVLWFGRMGSAELAFYLACSERLAERDYGIVDVTALRGMQRVSIAQPEILTSLLGEQQSPDSQERQQAADCWRQLRSEDAPFRVVTPEGLVSAPTEHFDGSLLSHIDGAWRNVNRVVADTMGLSFEPYWQVGDLMLKARLVALAASGRIELTGDPIERATMVRLVAASA